MHKSQRGYIDFERGVFETLFVLAAIGAIGVIFLAGYGAWWLFHHIQFV